MRNFRTLGVLFIMALFVAAPAFPKVCHPRQPVTCNAAEFSRPAAPAAVTATPQKPAKAMKATTPAKTQQARICGPWINYMCSGTNTLG
jgi:hypothetical protein